MDITSAIQPSIHLSLEHEIESTGDWIYMRLNLHEQSKKHTELK